MAHSTMEEVAALAGALGFGGIVVKLIELRARKREAAAAAQAREPADLIRAAGELQQALTDGGKELMAAFIAEFRFLRGEVIDLRTAHAGCEQELATVHNRLDSEILARAELQAKLDEMMAGPPASY